MNDHHYYGVAKPKAWATATKSVNGRGTCPYCSTKIAKGSRMIRLRNGFGGAPTIHLWCAVKLVIQCIVGYSR